MSLPLYITSPCGGSPKGASPERGRYGGAGSTTRGLRKHLHGSLGSLLVYYGRTELGKQCRLDDLDEDDQRPKHHKLGLSLVSCNFTLPLDSRQDQLVLGDVEIMMMWRS